MPSSPDVATPNAIEVVRGSPETVRRVGLFLLVAWLVFAVFTIQPYRFVINRTDSEPLGVYMIHLLTPQTKLAVGDLVAFAYEAPYHFAPYSAYPDGTSFLKHIAAMPGAVLNTEGRCEFADGKPLGCALKQTPSTKVPIPYFAHFAHTKVPPGHYYMQGDGNPASYDSRYYGLVPRTRITGTATALWLW